LPQRHQKDDYQEVLVKKKVEEASLRKQKEKEKDKEKDKEKKDNSNRFLSYLTVRKKKVIPGHSMPVFTSPIEAIEVGLPLERANKVLEQQIAATTPIPNFSPVPMHFDEIENIDEQKSENEEQESQSEASCSDSHSEPEQGQSSEQIDQLLRSEHYNQKKECTLFRPSPLYKDRCVICNLLYINHPQREGEVNSSSVIELSSSKAPALPLSFPELPQSRRMQKSQSLSPDQRYCGECGSILTPFTNWCPKCGTSISLRSTASKPFPKTVWKPASRLNSFVLQQTEKNMGWNEALGSLPPTQQKKSELDEILNSLTNL